MMPRSWKMPLENCYNSLVHHIHHTEAIVLGGYAKGEADKQISLYTRDLGLVRAEARGVRKMSSKLRFALQPYMVVQVDLINTKVAYRAGSTDLIQSLNTPDMATLGLLHRIAELLRRLVPEEEKNEALYDAIIEVMNFLSKNNKENPTIDIASLELLAVLRILFHLGYITWNDERTLIREPITEEILRQVAVRRESLVKEVNKSLRETML